MDDQLITAEEVAHLLRIKLSTVYDAVAKGRLPAVRLWRGRRRSLIRFRRDEIEELLRKRSCPVKESTRSRTRNE